MGQGPSSQAVKLETRIEDPSDGQAPAGLALIAHGRLGGNYDGPPIRRLAEYFRDERRLRVVTWNSRGNGASEGGSEWTDLGIWMGDAGVNDYNRQLRDAINWFCQEFPDSKNAELFICGYSAGAIYAGCTRHPPLPQFLSPRYVFLSYPVDANVLVGLWKTGSYYRSLEALVQGHGWENLPREYNGIEPAVLGVLTIMGSTECFFGYGLWTKILQSKNRRGILTQAVVPDATHDWNGKERCIPDEVRKWLAKSDL